MWELDHKEGWALKNWCFWTVVLEKTFESPLNSKEIKLVNPKGNHPWIFTERTDAEAEATILWPPDAKKSLEKDTWWWKKLKAGGEGMTKDEVFGWDHQLNGHEFEQHWEIVKDGEAWRAAVHWVAKGWTWLSIWTINNICSKCIEKWRTVHSRKSAQCQREE